MWVPARAGDTHAVVEASEVADWRTPAALVLMAMNGWFPILMAGIAPCPQVNARVRCAAAGTWSPGPGIRWAPTTLSILVTFPC